MLNKSEIINDKSAIPENNIEEFVENFAKTDTRAPTEQFVKLLADHNAVWYFKYNTHKYCELHAIAINQMQDSDVFIAFLNNENTFQKAVTERDEFYANFFDILLLPLIKASARFGVFEVTSKIVHKCIFSRNLKQFDNYFGQLLEKKKFEEKFGLCKALIKFMAALYSHDVSGFGFKLIFHSFANAFNNFGLSYKFLIILTEIVGFSVKDEFKINKIKYQASDTSLNKSLIIINQLFDVITMTRIELDHTVNGITFSDFFTNFLKSLIPLTQNPNSECHQILLKIVEINPLIIESCISDIIIYVMLNNSDCRDTYEEVVIKILLVFSKLHRFQNFISKMIPVLKTNIENRKFSETIYTFRGALDINNPLERGYNTDVILPKSLFDYFTSCVINLASWQVINLFKTLLFHLTKAVEELPQFKGESAQSIFIEILSTLTCWVLLSVRMAEHTVAPTTVEKFVGGLEELRTILGSFGVALLHKEHNHILMRAFLNICYHWAEIFITLEYYSTNNSVKMKRIVDNNPSAWNLTYLHSYLSGKKWCLISERITNFGEKPCKEIMQKLLVQKLRAILIFEGDNNDLIARIIRELAVDLNACSSGIFTDKFIVGVVLPKLPSAVIVALSEELLKEGVPKQSHIYDSQLLTDGLLCVIFSKIAKLLKQKRKLDEGTVKKALFSKMWGALPSNVFLSGDVGEYFGEVGGILTASEDDLLDIRMQADKILRFLHTMRDLGILFCSPNTQKLVVLLLMGLLRDINGSKCDDGLKKSCESLIISIVQYKKFDFLDVFEPRTLLKVVVGTFERYEDLFSSIANSVFKQDDTIVSFQSGIDFVTNNIKESHYLRLATVVLNILGKIKKTKIATSSKELCSQYKSQISSKIAKTIPKKKPEDYLLEPYAVVLKTSLAKEEDDISAKLKNCLADYVDFALSNTRDDNLKGSLLLFTTILHHKPILAEFGDDLVLKIWNNVKIRNIPNESSEEYSRLVMLIVSLIPNEQFLNIFQDLLAVTEKSMEEDNTREFSKHLNTWSCIITTNFNPTKTTVLREQLEFLLEKLILTTKRADYREDLVEEVIQFETAIIQTNHLPLTSPIVDLFLCTVTTLAGRNPPNFPRVFALAVSLLENLLRHRNALMMDRLPPFLLQYRILLRGLCENGASSDAEVADCAHKLEKLTKSLVESAKDMARIAMYLVADILGHYEVHALHANVKIHLNNCVYSLISLCDQHAVQHLMRVLSNASTEIFKMMYENYKRYYRYTGKV